MPEFSADWLQQNLTVSMCVYKNLSFLACGNPDNYGAKFAFDEQFPKYAAISTLSTEFQNSGVHAQLHRGWWPCSPRRKSTPAPASCPQA
jgi:hypothetical protein